MEIVPRGTVTIPKANNAVAASCDPPVLTHRREVQTSRRRRILTAGGTQFIASEIHHVDRMLLMVKPPPILTTARVPRGTIQRMNNAVAASCEPPALTHRREIQTSRRRLILTGGTQFIASEIHHVDRMLLMVKPPLIPTTAHVPRGTRLRVIVPRGTIQRTNNAVAASCDPPALTHQREIQTSRGRRILTAGGSQFIASEIQAKSILPTAKPPLIPTTAHVPRGTRLRVIVPRGTLRMRRGR
jgi:dihydrofolate reductase